MTQSNPTDTLHYSGNFSGFIWKLIPDASFQSLWVELRSEIEMSVSWKKIAISKGVQEPVEEPIDISWWDSLVAAYGNILVVNRIEEKTNPGPGIIRLINAISGKELFKLQQAVFIGLNGQMLVYQKSGESAESFLDLSKWENMPVGDILQVSIPSVYPVSHDYHQIIFDFLEARGIIIKGPTSYYEFESSILIYYHQKEGDKLTGTLTWIKEGNVHFSDKIDHEMSGYSQESFLVMGRYLIFVADRKWLYVHLL